MTRDTGEGRGESERGDDAERIRGETERTDAEQGRSRTPRRRFLQATGVAGLGALAGCTFSVDENGISWGDGGDGSTPGRSTPTDQPGSSGDTSTPGDTEASDDTETPEDTATPELEDGTGEGDPAETVSGTRDGIDITVGPSEDVGEDAGDDEFPVVVAEPVDPEPIVVNATWNTTDTSNALGSFGNRLRLPSLQASDDDNVECTTEERTIEAGSQEALLLNPEQQIFYPGALVDVRTIPTGEYERVNAERAPLTLSVDLPPSKLAGSSTRVVDEPSLSSVREASNQILRNVNPDAGTLANMAYSYERVYDESQTNVLLGVHYEDASTEVNSSFGYDTRSTHNRVLVQFVQRYFGIDVDTENRAFFADGRTPDPTTALVSRVNYGRTLLFSIESETEATTLEASVDATFDAFAGEGGASVDTSHREVMEEAKVDVTVIGGGAEDAATAISGGVDAIGDFIQAGANYGPSSPGAPISYQLTYLSDLSNAGMHLATEYVQRECVELVDTYAVDNVQLVADRIDDASGDDLEVYGNLRVQGFYEDANGNEQTVYARGESDEYVWENDSDHTVILDETARRTDITADATVTFPDITEIDQSKAYIRIHGHLYEADTWPNDDDDLGWEGTKIYLDDLGSGIDIGEERLQFTEGEQEVHVEFTLTPVHD